MAFRQRFSMSPVVRSFEDPAKTSDCQIGTQKKRAPVGARFVNLGHQLEADLGNRVKRYFRSSPTEWRGEQDQRPSQDGAST